MGPETPETPTKQTADDQQLRRESIIEELADSNLDELMAAAKARKEERNRIAQAQLPPPPAMQPTEWAAREAWLHDGQAIHGELKEFAWAAHRAAKAGDQVTFSRQRDLLYKAVLTFVGLPPVEEKA